MTSQKWEIKYVQRQVQGATDNEWQGRKHTSQWRCCNCVVLQLSLSQLTSFILLPNSVFEFQSVAGRKGNYKLQANCCSANVFFFLKKGEISCDSSKSHGMCVNFANHAFNQPIGLGGAGIKNDSTHAECNHCCTKLTGESLACQTWQICQASLRQSGEKKIYSRIC